MGNYTPTIGQAVFGNPHGEYELSNIGEAAVMCLLDEMRIRWWNEHQSEWNYENYGGKFETRPYWWGDNNHPDSEKPNLAFRGVEIRWYKYPGRGMSCNQDLSPQQWSDWLNAALVSAVRDAGETEVPE